MKNPRALSSIVILLSMFCICTAAFSAPALTKADRESALKAAGFSLRGKQVINECGEVADIKIITVDLNGDGILEVFVQDFSEMCYGATGGSLVLLIKDSSGHWKKNLNFPAIDYKLLKTKNKGYPDIEIGGPGSCSPVWRWNGKEYDIYKKCDR
jgi:hypothetical protein